MTLNEVGNRLDCSTSQIKKNNRTLFIENNNNTHIQVVISKSVKGKSTYNPK
jgi:hypothetical protein